tara:strand:+ start:514 stop:1281 length:768 start_codon:yes stop_codon:yes gene_type:complete
MAFNISDFRANLVGTGSRGVSKQGHFELVISLPRKIILSDRSKRAYDSLRFRIEEASLPGRSIKTTDHKHLGYGLTSKIGYDVTYPDVSLSLICGADLGEKSLFQAWQSSIIGNHSRNQDIRRHQSIGYYDNYTSSIAIIKYDDTGKAVYTLALAEAYPVIINALPLSWSADGLHKLNVSFTYKYFTESDEPAAGKGAGLNKAGASLTINGLPSIDDAFEGLGLPRIGEILNIPIFDTENFTLTGASDFKGIFNI